MEKYSDFHSQFPTNFKIHYQCVEGGAERWFWSTWALPLVKWAKIASKNQQSIGLVAWHDPPQSPYGPQVVVDLAEVLRAAVPGSGPFQPWALATVQASAALFHARSPVAAVALPLAPAAGPSDRPGLVSLLSARLQHLAQDRELLEAWVRALRVALEPLLVRAQPHASTGLLALRCRSVNSGPLRMRCKRPVFPVPPLTPLTSRQSEASWLLDCHTVRDGVQRHKDLLLVNLPAYLTTAAQLGRLFWGDQRVPLPALSAGRQAWFAAATAWRNFLLQETGRQWARPGDSHELARVIGWNVPPDVPMLLLSRSQLERELRGAAAEVGEVTLVTAPKRLRPLSVEYQGQTLSVFRRFVGPQGRERLFFQVPYPLPEGYVPPDDGSFYRRRQFYLASPELERLIPQVGDEATWFLAFAQEIETLFAGEAYDQEVQRRRYADRVTGIQSGSRTRMGPYTDLERDAVRRYLEERLPGAFEEEDWQALADLLPGRNTRAVKSLVTEVLQAEVRRVRWPDFKRSGFWPGGELARRLYDLVSP